MRCTHSCWCYSTVICNWVLGQGLSRESDDVRCVVEFVEDIADSEVAQSDWRSTDPVSRFVSPARWGNQVATVYRALVLGLECERMSRLASEKAGERFLLLGSNVNSLGTSRADGRLLSQQTPKAAVA